MDGQTELVIRVPKWLALGMVVVASWLRAAPPSPPSASGPVASALVATNAVRGPVLPSPQPTALLWDAMAKEYTAKPGEADAVLTFSVTNVSPAAVHIRMVRASCGCTVPILPRQPWVLEPGQGGELKVSVDLRGKRGTLNKHLSVDSSAGFILLGLMVHIPDPAAEAAAAMTARGQNLVAAMADRQAVFKSDCAKCHLEPTRGKYGEPLYAAACGICHDSSHRATMVPDLRGVRHLGGSAYWRHWIVAGKEKSLMPAFGQAAGGPLTESQINSLVEFLSERYDSPTQAQPPPQLPRRSPTQPPLPQPNEAPPLPGAPR